MATKVLFVVNICYFVVVFVASGVSDYLSRRLLQRYGRSSSAHGSLFVVRALKSLKADPRLSSADRRRAKLHYFIQTWGFFINILLFLALLVVFWIESK